MWIENSWYQVSFNKLISISSYSLKSWVINVPKSWKFEGSTNGYIWYPLHNISDNSILVDGQYHNFKVTNRNNAYSMFRYTMIGPRYRGDDTNIDYCLEIYGLEIFGTFYRDPFCTKYYESTINCLMITIQILFVYTKE